MNTVILPLNKESPQNMEQIFANVSHEFKTPLISLVGSIDQLERFPLYPEQQLTLSGMEEHVWSLMRIVEKVLTLQRIEFQTYRTNPEDCCLRDILEKTIQPLKQKSEKKGLAFHWHLEEGVPEQLHLDNQILQEVLHHLLDNAIKFTEEGKVNLLIDQKQGKLRIHVIDTGVGITPEVSKHLFECYYQADSSFSRQYNGIGCGLFICRELLQLVGGEIWQEPLAQTGSCFVFEMPFMPAHSIVEKESSASASIFLKAPRILLAEDHVENQYLLQDMLERYGFEVIVASNGVEAIHALHKTHIDLVLMDMQMPLMDGYEATRLIRESPEWSSLPIIAITAHNHPGDRAQCLASGCNHYLAKPFKIDNLVDIICSLLNAVVPEAPSSNTNELIEMLMPQFIQGLKNDSQKLEEAYRTADYSTIQKIGHAIKGTAGLYQQNFVAILGKKIEQQGKNQEETLPQILQILKNTCDHLEYKYGLEKAASNL